MSNSQSMASVQRPRWATASRIDDETPATIYHSSQRVVADGGDQLRVELFTADRFDIENGHVELVREVPQIEFDGGIIALEPAVRLALTLTTLVVNAITAMEPHQAPTGLHAISALDDLIRQMRRIAVLGENGARCGHGYNPLADSCPNCDIAADESGAKAGA